MKCDVVVIHCGCDVLYYLVDSRVVLLSVRGRERVCAVSTYRRSVNTELVDTIVGGKPISSHT